MRTEILDSFGDSIVVSRMAENAPNPQDVKVVFYAGSEQEHDESMMMSISADDARALAKALLNMADEVERPR